MEVVGRPAYTNQQYQTWLSEMEPFIKLGNTLYYSMCRVGLEKHKKAIYDKKNKNDWFREKIVASQREPGEIANSLIVGVVYQISERFRRGVPLSRQELRFLMRFAVGHRSCQPFFVSRTETAGVKGEGVGKILGRTETNYVKLGEKASERLKDYQQ